MSRPVHAEDNGRMRRTDAHWRHRNIIAASKPGRLTGGAGERSHSVWQWRQRPLDWRSSDMAMKWKRWAMAWLLYIQVRWTLCDTGDKMCRDRLGLYSPDQFTLHTCAMCYHYLELRPYRTVAPEASDTRRPHTLVLTNGSLPLDEIHADPDNSTTVNAICALLEKPECSRWQDCCRAAKDCCQWQLSASSSTDAPRCPGTWDGYSCWGDTDPGVTKRAACPHFMDKTLTTRSATKTCTRNASWFIKEGREWTDYTHCVDKERYLVGLYLCVACSAASICLLVPAITIFLYFRELIRQHRIRLHVHFFVSLVLNGVATILWYLLVQYDALVILPKNQTVIFNNPTWCRLLSFLKIYLTSTTYFWMFCEGSYLHRLITNAFKPPKSLSLFYITGWGGPLFPAAIYAILRGTVSNKSCWVQSHGYYEWIFYAPNLVCLMLNLLFLCNILRILFFELHSHPHEPNNFRRGFKAVFMLVPLFGLQLFLAIYRPPDGSPGDKEYEYVTFIVTNSQGIFVSLIFCFFNGEVLSHMRDCRTRSGPLSCIFAVGGRDMPMTQVSTVPACEEDEVNAVPARCEDEPGISNKL